ncbi:spore germination protein KB [Paenibacillus sp. yr247]|uniref:GerAB/ArcD/ProY family transporter n=1 Tax=Paenibacillus sp. yr247 TaxID=1761880 RepID=UPI00088638AE|nr:endospore germination permease [Paenibacillus sp. yr247]SDN03773.1 spore germination protein KB [Paenibacillus sp. yr247]
MKEKISARQFKLLVILFSIGTTILVIPSGLAADAKQDAWIAAVIGTIIGMCFTKFYVLMGRQLGEHNWIDYSKIVLGKWLGNFLNVLFVFFCFIGASTLLFYIGNFMNTQIMPETPIEFINILFALIVVMGVRLGVETLARAAEVFFPYIVLLFLFLLVFISPEMDFNNLRPLFETGVKPLTHGVLSMLVIATFPLIVMFMIYPFQIDTPERAEHGFIKASFVGGIFMIGITFMCVTVLGFDTTKRLVYPSYELAKIISVGHFVDRVESSVAAFWILAIYFKTSLYFYGFVTGLGQLCQLTQYRSIVFPCGMLIVVYSLVVYPNVTYMHEWDDKVFIPYAIFMGVVIPALLFVVGKIRSQSLDSKG